jgi:hypothetical protein
VKDKINVKQQTNCIYCVSCRDCEEEYWGMTQQRVGRRLDQHLGDIELLVIGNVVSDKVEYISHIFRLKFL